MHTDLDEKIIARRLSALADEPAEAPYDWDEFERRRHGAASGRNIGRIRRAAMATAAVAAVVVAGFAIIRASHQDTQAFGSPSAAARSDLVARRDVVSPNRVARTRVMDTASPAQSAVTADRLTQARTRAIEGWLAGLPHDPAVVRVGAHAAVTGLQDQIAVLDDLMSAARVAGAEPSRLDALRRRRAQLVSSLAQLRYAEMLASATP
jgi:hypothetical protein